MAVPFCVSRLNHSIAPHACRKTDLHLNVLPATTTSCTGKGTQTLLPAF